MRLKGTSALAKRLRARLSRNVHPGREQGFTLIELVIVLVIMPVVVAGIAVAVITTLKSESGVQNRVVDAAAAQIVTTNFTSDVQNATQVTTSSSASGVCTPTSRPSGSTLVVAFNWLSQPGGSQAEVAYWKTINTSSTPTTYGLIRYVCGTATSTVALFDSSQVVPSVTITCNTACSSYSSTWLSTVGVKSVALDATATQSGYHYLVQATPRSWNSSLTGENPSLVYPPLTLLGSSCPLLTLSANNDTVQVTGDIGINGNCSSALTGSGNGDSISATGTLNVYNCHNPCPQSVESGGSYSFGSTSSVSSQYPAPTVSEPSVSGLTTVTCSSSSGVTTCPPGKYTSAVNLPSGTVNFTGGGTYLFQQAVTTTGTSGTTVNFGSGNYVFQAGFATSNNSTLNGNGDFFYFAGGSYENTANNNNVSLSAQTSGPYAGILMYQVSTDSTTMTIVNNANSAQYYNGQLELPGANLSVNSNNQPVVIASIIAQSVTLQGNSALLQITGSP